MIIPLSILGYAIVMIAIGVYAARKVKNSEDYVLGRKKSSILYGALDCVCHMVWFGIDLRGWEQICRRGIPKCIEDPFGAGLCLIIAGIFFNRKLYRLHQFLRSEIILNSDLIPSFQHFFRL
jgi:SSS family solute:Na+ symporter